MSCHNNQRPNSPSNGNPCLTDGGELAGVELKFATARDIPTFEKRLAAGEYDVAYMNPYHFTLVNQTPGYTAIAHAKDKKITGILVTKADWKGDLQDLQQQMQELQRQLLQQQHQQHQQHPQLLQQQQPTLPIFAEYSFYLKNISFMCK